MGRRPTGASRFTEANTKHAQSNLAQLAADNEVLAEQIVAKSTAQERILALSHWNA